LLGKQTLKQHDRSIPWIKKQLDAFEPKAREIDPSTITIVADATFYGRKSDRLGTLVFKDVLNNKIVACKHIDTETANDYKQLVEELTEQGFVIQGVTIDGKRGVAKAFSYIPVQMCHFHQIAIIKRYLTSRPKLEASIELLKLCRRIPTSTQSRFTDSRPQGGYNSIRGLSSLIDFTRDELLGSFAHANPDSELEQLLNQEPLFESIPLLSRTFEGGLVDLAEHLPKLDLLRYKINIHLFI
jgi:hypothetical protein